MNQKYVNAGELSTYQLKNPRRKRKSVRVTICDGKVERLKRPIGIRNHRAGNGEQEKAICWQGEMGEEKINMVTRSWALFLSAIRHVPRFGLVIFFLFDVREQPQLVAGRKDAVVCSASIHLVFKWTQRHDLPLSAVFRKYILTLFVKDDKNVRRSFF